MLYWNSCLTLRHVVSTCLLIPIASNNVKLHILWTECKPISAKLVIFPGLTASGWGDTTGAEKLWEGRKKKNWEKKGKKPFKIIFERGKSFGFLRLELLYPRKESKRRIQHLPPIFEPPIIDEKLSPKWIIRVYKNLHICAYMYLHLFNIIFWTLLVGIHCTFVLFIQ